ncbi:MAG TPA: PspC domain-containing protein [archaeon]|nr:PspC domain-containing protein [archaeon]
MKKLFRSRKNKMLGGIFGGVEELTGIDATALRVITAIVFVLTAIFTAWIIPVLMVIIYVLCWGIIPKKEEEKADTSRETKQKEKKV